MLRRAAFAAIAAASLSLASAHASHQAGGAVPAQADLRPITIVVDGVERTGLLYAPPGAASRKAPVVFVFHGHGGTAANIARGFALHRHWPEAMVVYLQGLPTPGRLTDPTGLRAGWQAGAGDQGDRDLKLFDAVLARLTREFTIEPTRVFATGHSNGGGFTYLLWARRGDRLAAVAPSAAAAIQLLKQLQPKPAMHLAGQKDPLVRFDWQRQTMDGIRRLNGCASTGTSWAPLATIYPSAPGTPCVEYIHPGGHQYPADAPALIAKFFRELR